MLYYLFEFLEKQYEFPGASVFQYLSFRAAVAIIFSLGFSLISGRRIIRYLKNKQIEYQFTTFYIRIEYEYFI